MESDPVKTVTLKWKAEWSHVILTLPWKREKEKEDGLRKASSFLGGKKYALKARAEREQVLKKAQDLVANPQKYTKATSFGAAKYVTNVKYDEETGEVLEFKNNPALD